MKLKIYQKILIAFVGILAFLPMISAALCDYPLGGSGGGP